MEGSLFPLLVSTAKLITTVGTRGSDRNTNTLRPGAAILAILAVLASCPCVGTLAGATKQVLLATMFKLYGKQSHIVPPLLPETTFP